MGIHPKITAEAARSLLATEETEIPEKSPVSPCPRVAVIPYFSTPSIAIKPSVMLYTACAIIAVVVL